MTHPERPDPFCIRLVLAEDQAMVRGALAALLGLEPDLRVLRSSRSCWSPTSRCRK